MAVLISIYYSIAVMASIYWSLESHYSIYYIEYIVVYTISIIKNNLTKAKFS